MSTTEPATEPTVVTTESAGTQHVWALPTDEATLLDLLTELFTEHWRHINFGPIIEGAAWEVGAPGAPESITTHDGYLTVDFGAWHFHLCIGEHTASGPELGRIRRCSRAELYRGLNAEGAPVTWGLRLFNGRDEQMMTVLLPNPFLTDRQQVRREPDFSRLETWDVLRERFLGLSPDPLDRAGRGFSHG
ncbi:DUF7676 family protein [Streptomyces alkaliterrae]|uniref:Uncharacterized protein n=1 Tax=Streptomyces alkaliterrae TaxID=2213162 RepID=A0A5P0YVX5_9ACTN|nr:hypothetical protein [Streptomyces alkaliterrae]MBB1254233.1 hypothetical protein [Streptomyces alkaliterrae]MBB1258058.1 hypothetical protein [Streptomyces alkaliterrae]MQS02619.1 hypothetical protein [Streptomyces alkaliterrae]